jgi:hypothetical protein
MFHTRAATPQPASRYYALVLEYQRNRHHVKAAAAAAVAGGSSSGLFVEVMRVREPISGITLDLDFAPNITVAVLKDRIHEVQNINRSCVRVMAGCDLLPDGMLLQVTCDV